MTVVSLVSEGLDWTRWKSFTLFKSLDLVQHSLSMTTTDRDREGIARWNVNGGSEVNILIDNSKVFDGFVRRFNHIADGEASHEIFISAESRAIDLVEGGHEGPYFWEGSAEQVVDDVLSPYGFDYTISDALDPLPEEGFRVGVNDSPYDIVRRIAERNGLLIWTDGSQSIRISRGPVSLASTSLGPCDYTAIDTDFDLTNRYSKIIVKWQRNNFEVADDDDVQSTQVVWEDDGSLRYRPLVIIESGPEQAQRKLAQYVAHRATGNAISVNVTCKSPFDPDGNLWDLGHRVYIENPVLGLDDDLIVYQIEFAITESQGFEARLGLRPESAYTSIPVERREVRRASEVIRPTVAPISELNPLEFVP